MDQIINYLCLPLSLFGIVAIEAMGLQLILGGAGLLTLGHTAFFAIGGYASAAFVTMIAPILGIENQVILLLAGMLFGMLCSALTAAFIVMPCLRLKGDYLAVATMGLGQIVENIFNNLTVFGGASGFTNITHLTNVWLILGIVFLIIIFLKRFYKTGIGNAILCSRDDEIVARCFGISPAKSKLIAFLVGNIITGLAGSLYVHTFQFISPVYAGFQKSVEILLAVVIGGMFSVWGSLLGAAILVLVPELLRFVPQIMTENISDLMANGVVSSKLSYFFIGFLQNSMLIFSLIVLIILKINSTEFSRMLSKIKDRIKNSDLRYQV